MCLMTWNVIFASCYPLILCEKENGELVLPFLIFLETPTKLFTSVTVTGCRFSIDFGKNEVEVLKHASNYLESADSETLLELLSNTQLKVTYQPYDWGLNC